MNLEVIANLIMLMENSTLSTLEVESNGMRVRMETQRGWGQEQSMTQMPKALAQMPTQGLHAAPQSDDTTAALQEEAETVQTQGAPIGHREITSPMVGTYHELKKNPVKIGTKLKAGDPVCILEAMKVMNEIVAEEDGVVSWVACQEGDMVEYGQLLITYQ